MGGGGPNQPVENPDFPDIKTLAVPNVAAPREVTATLSKNPVLDAGAADYSWPAVSSQELGTTAIRVASAPVAGTAGNDLYQVGLDAAWLDLYGWEKGRPAEVQGLGVAKAAAGALEVTFTPLAGAQRYNLYVGPARDPSRGALRPWPRRARRAYVRGARARRGSRPAENRLGPAQQPPEPSYFLVTAHVDDVESPSGTRTGGIEIDRSQSVCR